MSDTRFDGDGGDGDEIPYELWLANLWRSINGRRGQKALAELEAALLALPRKRLISGHLCEAGEVCAIGALALKKRVDAGESAEAALEELADVYSEDADATARFGTSLGMSYTLAWEIARVNDDLLAEMTPEQRYDEVLSWVRRLVKTAQSEEVARGL